MALVGTINAPNDFGFKNKIINGAMVIDQRNAGASVTLATGTNYVVDRLNMYKGTAGATVTGQQASASIAGFEKCAVLTTTVASAPAAGDINGIWQVIEGLNTLDLQWGTANAKACTVSFWFKAATSGTYALSILSGTGDLSYVATFNATSTFTYFSFYIPAPTTGKFYEDTLAAMYVTIDTGSGTSYNTSTTGSWIAGNFKRTSACVNSTSSTNTLSLTGFQFEVGSTATSFDYRPFGTELILCQRYFEKSYDTFSPVPTNTTLGNHVGTVDTQSLTAIAANIRFRVEKRSNPTMNFYKYDTTAGVWARNSDNSNTGTITTPWGMGSTGVGRLDSSTSLTSGAMYHGQWSATAEL